MRLIVLGLAYNGLLGLCLAMPKHYKQALPHEPTPVVCYLLKIVGWLTLALSFSMDVASAGWSFGPVEWVGLLAVAGLALVFLLPYTPLAAVFLGLIGFVYTSVALLL